MNKEAIIDLVYKAAEKSSGDLQYTSLYKKIFGTNPYIYNVGLKAYTRINSDHKWTDEPAFNNIDIFNKLSTNICIEYIDVDRNIEELIIGDKFIVVHDNYSDFAKCFRVVTDNPENFKCVQDLMIEYVEPVETKFRYITHNNVGFSYQSFNIKTTTSLDNYNDDLPHEKILSWLKNEGGLVLFYGIPGTGKTSYIKSLVYEHPDTIFYVIDPNVLGEINNSAFLSFLVDHPGVYIIEDCEKLVMRREHSDNGLLAVLLNLTDGLLGSAIGIKFICTFNTNLTNIDPALLRKGRLKIKYEFGKLKKDKAQKIGDKIGVQVTEDITLADLYNQEKNDYTETQKKSIGFV